jgi:hypothetical protein
VRAKDADIKGIYLEFQIFKSRGPPLLKVQKICFNITRHLFEIVKKIVRE